MIERNAKYDHKDRIDVLMRKAQMGDWFLIFLLSKNIDSILFKEFIDRLTDKLKTDAQDELIWDTDPSQVLLQVELSQWREMCLLFSEWADVDSEHIRYEESSVNI